MRASVGSMPPRPSIGSAEPKITTTIATPPTAAARQVLKNQRNPPRRASALSAVYMSGSGRRLCVW